MNLFEARNLAVALMHQHGIADWSFRFDHARRRFGSCRPTQKLITLSRPLTFLNNVDEVRDTILHEIAHALAPGDGHGRRWKQACRQIGARPIRCYTNEQVVSPPRRAARYLIGCATCNWWHERRRLVSRRLLCKMCRSDVVYQDRATGERFVMTSSRS